MLYKGKREKIELILIYTVITLLILAYVVPFIWLFLGSLKTSTEVFAIPQKIFPKVPQWSNYKFILTDFPFFLYLKNTLIIIFFNIIGATISNTLVAYGFSRIEWRGRDKVFVLVLMTMMLPFQVTMIPLFLFYKKIGFIGTLLPLIVPSFFGNAFFIFLLRQFFIGIPKELSQSAKIDGANEFTIYKNVILPLTKPAIATIGIFTFLNCWNDFTGPLLFLNDSKLYTLSIGVQQIMSNNDPRWTLLMTAGVTMTLPVLIVFFVSQKYFIEGIAFTGLKG